MNHLLYTRYDVEAPRMAGYDEWVKHRDELFKRFCLPSIIEQSRDADFKWTVYFDRKSKSVHQGSEFFTSIYVKDFDEMNKHRKETIEWMAPVVVTRLDNDDALVSGFMKETQKAIRTISPNGFVVVNFPPGWIVCGNKLYSLPNEFGNPFISVFMPRWKDGIIGPHSRMAKTSYTVQIFKRLWIRVIHVRNKSNKLKGTLIKKKPVDIMPWLATNRKG